MEKEQWIREQIDDHCKVTAVERTSTEHIYQQIQKKRQTQWERTLQTDKTQEKTFFYSSPIILDKKKIKSKHKQINKAVYHKKTNT